MDGSTFINTVVAQNAVLILAKETLLTTTDPTDRVSIIDKAHLLQAGLRDQAEFVKEKLATTDEYASFNSDIDAAMVALDFLDDELETIGGGTSMGGFGRSSLAFGAEGVVLEGIAGVVKSLWAKWWTPFVVVGGGVAAALGAAYVWRNWNDPSGIKQYAETIAYAQQLCADRINAAAGDPAALANAQKFCRDLQDFAGGNQCGMLDSPLWTIVGGLIGIGVGWSFMRALMRL